MEKARWLALGIAMTFLASGCAQWTAMTRQDKIIVSTIGCAAAGAGIGAAAGSGGHASGRGAVIGGLTSALICGTLAYFMTEEGRPAPAPAPQARPTPPPPAAAARERTIVLDNVLFDFDKTAIKPDGAKILDRLIVFLKDNSDKRVDLEGHTDSVGTEKYNQALSERRAASVKEYLTKRGVDASRITTRGFGLTKPIADNKTAEGRAKNRRVEIKVR
ncbi:MAG TPA: OmpA family protein [Candidatus Binatia bacterium]